MKKNILVVLFFITLVTLVQGCKKSCSNDGYLKYYKGYYQITIMSDVDSVRVGDSIHFEMKIPFRFLNIRDSSYVDASNLNLPSFYSFPFHENFVNGIRKSNDVNVYTLIQKTGKSKLVMGEGVVCNFSIMNNEYKLRYVLIPKEKGIMSVEFGPILGQRDKNCTDFDFIPKIQNTNKLHYLHHQYLIANGHTPIWIANPETYIIKVVD